MPSHTIRVLASVAAFALVTTFAHGAEPATATHACASVTEPAARLACYDKAFPPADDALTLAEKARRDFGLNQADEPEPMEAAEPDSIEATVASVSGNPGSGRVIRLDNGQAWRQTESTSMGMISAGDRISIRNAAFSSHMLVTQGGASLRVKRIR